MGLDLYIEARISRKDTRKIISYAEYPEDDEGKGFFEICCWSSWYFLDLRTKMIEIGNKYSERKYSDTDFTIPIPQSALYEIYEYISQDPCGKDFSNGNAEKLYHLFCTLNSLKHDNEIIINNKHIPNTDDLVHLKENPELYEWEFRIFNSY